MRIIFNLIIIGHLTYCGDMENRPEVVNKLRTVGVKVSKTIFDKTDSASTSFQTEAVVLLPKDVKIKSVTSFRDPRSQFYLYSELQIDETSETYLTLGPLSLFTVKATGILPFVNEDLLRSFNGVANIRYGMQIRSEDNEEENIVGDIIFVAEDSPAISWKGKNPLITLAEPSDDTSLTSGETIKIRANITKPIDDLYKISWFVSAGEVKNYRSSTTEWLLPEPGEHLLLVAVHATRSRKFDYTYKQVKIQ